VFPSKKEPRETGKSADGIEDFAPVHREPDLPSADFPRLRSNVRIALHTNKSELDFSSPGRVEILESTGDLITRIVSLRGKFTIRRDGRLLVISQGNNVRVGSATGVLQIKSINAYNTIAVGGLSYRGSMEVLPGEGNVMTVINSIHIEEYLRGVLPYEMPSSDSGIIEALKAQAVAARTYAMAHQNQFARLDFDMYADERDQMYKGIQSETLISDKAVFSTRGVLLTFQGKLVSCYYHSTCGGHTADISQVWGRDSVPYLSAVPDRDPQGNNYCQASSYSSWSESWDKDQLTGIIKLNLKSAKPDKVFNFSRLTGLSILERTQSGRVGILEIKTDRGPILIRGDKTRWALRKSGNNEQILPSSWFDIKKIGSRIIIRGRGFGHGIGLCQTGAMGRARQGQLFDEILYSYYQGTQLVRLK
jgi:stage II sporulation protein D